MNRIFLRTSRSQTHCRPLEDCVKYNLDLSHPRSEEVVVFMYPLPYTSVLRAIPGDVKWLGTFKLVSAWTEGTHTTRKKQPSGKESWLFPVRK